jgi:acetoacetyl-CoA reductase
MIIEKIIDNQVTAVKHWHDTCDNFINSFNTFFDSSTAIFNNYYKLYPEIPGTAKSSSSLSSRYNKQIKLKTAIITGGIGGIGTAICKRLASDGNRIISTYISNEKTKAMAWKKELEQDGYEVEVYECDVSDYQSCQKFAALIEGKYDHIDVLVNGAGITRDSQLKKMDKENWDAVLDTNLDSVFNITRSFINGMLENSYGRIINISSVNGQKGQFGQTNYSTAKAGMIGFTRSLALEMAEKGITVNCVCPGYVGTPMVEAIREDILDGIVQQIPMKRLAKVEEIADAVAFLADSNSAYITGTEIAVNGGLWMG